MEERRCSIKQFSYYCTQILLRFSRMAKRNQMSRSISALKSIEENVPNYYDSIAVTFERVALRQGPIIYEWFFEDSEVGTCSITRTSKHWTGSNKKYEVFACSNWERKKTRDSLLDKLLEKYVRKDTMTFKIKIQNDPPAKLPFCIFAKVISINLEEKVPDFDGWQSVFRGIRNDTKVFFYRNEHSDKLISLLQTPDIQRCRQLVIQYRELDFRIRSLFLDDDINIVGLEHPNILVEKPNFSINKFALLISRWIERRRPIETLFAIGVNCYSNILKHFDMCIEKFNGVQSKLRFEHEK